MASRMLHVMPRLTHHSSAQLMMIGAMMSSDGKVLSETDLTPATNLTIAQSGASFRLLLVVPKLSLCGSEAQPDVPVCCRYEFTECGGVRLLPPAQLDVSHAFAGAFQKACPVVECRSVEEADIHMSTEGVDVPKRRISHARGGMAIVQKLANVRAAAAHLFEPWPGDPSQLAVGLGKPGVNAGVSLNRARKP